MRTLTIATLAFALLAPPGAGTAAQGLTDEIARARTMEMESVLQLTAEGAALYRADTDKATGYQYCRQAFAFAEQGEFRQAIRAASKALFLGQQTRDDDVLAHAKRDLAIAYSYAGNLERAEQYATEALRHAVRPASRGAVHSWLYKTLGDVAMRRGEPAKALHFYRRSVSLAGNELRFYSRLSIAAALVSANDTARAKEAVREAQSYLEVVSQGGAAGARSSLQRLEATIAVGEKDFERAATLLRSALAAAQGADAAYARFRANEGLARVFLARGDKENALEAYNGAIEASQHVRARFRSEEIKAGLFGEMKDAFDGAIELLIEAGRHEQAWQTNERGRARALLDAVRNRTTLSGGGQAFSDAAAATLRLADLTSSLGDREVLIEYYLSPTKAYAWVIRKSGLRSIELKTTRQELVPAVQRFRETIGRRGDTVREEAAALHERLLAPLELKDGEALIIVPHEILHYLPFHALHRGRDGYVIEGFEVSYAPSSATLLELLQKDARKKGVLVALANPDLNDPSRTLPAAEKEVTQIKELFQKSEAYFGRNATKRRLLERAADANVVHIAAHASVDRLDPLYSQIYLAGSGEEIGILEAHEIYRMNLHQAALITLSTCESGLGRVTRGDEIWGFTRSFLSAGAAALIVSLWPVADDSTERLMTTFYQGLAGSSSRASMRVAQLRLMKDASFSHPYYWAPFNLMGDWR